MNWGPTSANGSPARFVWVRSADGKAALAGLAAQPHKPKILKAPVTFDFSTGDSIQTESSRKYGAESFTRLAELDDEDVAELWTDADRLFAVFGLVAAEPAQGS
jgi:uncharacterized SAM-dependent methyltransferase